MCLRYCVAPKHLEASATRDRPNGHNGAVATPDRGDTVNRAWDSRRRRVCATVSLSLLLAVVATDLSAKSTGRPRRRAVDAIIVHSLGGPDCQNGTRFFTPVDGDARTWIARFATLPVVSIHYVVGRDGRVEAGIPESLAASHAVGWNQRSIGIELINNGDGADPFPEPQLEALGQLVQGIRERHPRVAIERILRHSDVDHSTFPAAPHGEACGGFRRKLDPGDAFPWDAFKAALSGR